MVAFRYIGNEALIAKGMAALREAVTQSAEDYNGKAIDAESAVRSGTLRSSIHVDSITSSAYEVKATIATGGEASAYAAYIHEGHRADGSHVIAAYPGGLKYMERPLIEHAPTHRAYVEAAAASLY